VFLLLFAVLICPTYAQDAAAWPGPTFSEFSGVNQGSPDGPLAGSALGWDRPDIGWSEVEPTQGDWRSDVLDKWGKSVLAYQAAGMHEIITLGYNTGWSYDHSGSTYEYGNRRWVMRPRSDGKFDYASYTKQPDNSWKQDGSGEVISGNSDFPLAKEHIQDWENYVRRVVTFFHKPPYNVEYFQIWNEAHPDSGFWNGNLDDYITRVHLPAAAIIHELGAKVVYGGWPCCAPLEEYTALLDKHQAWSSVDVFDVHYFPVSAYDYLRKAAIQRGIRNPSIWQSELGFTTDPTYISNTYPRILSWGLASGWTKPNQYKAFYFANWSPDDPKAFGYGSCLMSGSKLSAHGQSLQTLASLLGGGVLKLQPGVSSMPALKAETDERLSSMEAFRIGNRAVVAIHLSENNSAKIMVDPNGGHDMIYLGPGSHESIQVHLPFARSAIEAIERVDITGLRTDLAASAFASGDSQTQVSVPARDTSGSDAYSWQGEDGGVAAHVRTFYVAVTLK